MLRIKLVKNKNYREWIKEKSKYKNIKIINFFNIFLYSKNNINDFNLLFPIEFSNSKTLNNKSYYNNDIIRYSDLNKIYDYKIASILIKINKNFDIFFEQEFDLDIITLKISIKNINDTILSFYYHYDNQITKEKELIKILKGYKFMSDKLENKIIEKISEKMSFFDLDLKNYDYKINKISNFLFEVELIHRDKNALILIRNIEIDKENNIINIGKNKGLVF